MEWLNTYAPGIQAIASMAAFLVAALLAWLTYRYVRLTAWMAETSAQIAKTSADQIRAVQAAALEVRQRKARALKELSRRIRVPLKHLDPAAPNQQQMKQYAYLSEGDVVAMESLASEVGHDAIGQASLAAFALRVIHGQIMKAQSIEDWRPSAQEKVDWKSSLEGANEQLPKLEESCDGLIAQKA